ncbi:hypothetical protein ACEUZ9_004085 [Paracoccus litorisediminis]|uniref:hypothetical protein n=1 Tax=Paracoccus litorisediminis TaxID=2006130 RepID=UPI00372E9491
MERSTESQLNSAATAKARLMKQLARDRAAREEAGPLVAMKLEITALLHDRIAVNDVAFRSRPAQGGQMLAISADIATEHLDRLTAPWIGPERDITGCTLHMAGASAARAA